MARPSRPQLLARLRYASGDLASDRRADALALRPKLRAEYESRPAGQDPMRCEQCGKELARCLADGDATNCCHQKCVELLLAAKPDDVVPSYVAATYNKREALSTLLGAELDRRGVAKPEVKPKKYGGYGGEKIELVYG